jgi:hypothetical protein
VWAVSESEFGGEVREVGECGWWRWRKMRKSENVVRRSEEWWW